MNTEKTFSGFYAFDSTEAKTILAAKKAAEFPQLTTASGKAKLFRKIKWEKISYKGRDMEIPVIAAMCGDNEEKQITLSALFGKENAFVVDRENGDYKKGDRLVIKNLVEWSPELQSLTSARNEAIMSEITDDMEITIVTLWGHFDDSNKRSFNLTFVAEKATKL